MENQSNKHSPSLAALLPFLVFVLVYMATGIILNHLGVEMAFYQVPAPVCILPAIILAFIMFKGSVDDKFNDFVRGCGDENIIIMCLIYILAGAFATVSKESGGVDSVVNFALSIIPLQFITGGIFLIGCFISISTGTSVGTISTVGPIAVGLAQKGNLPLALVLGSLVGGAMFGDNLSVISDTTIAATRTQNVDMKDKFRANIRMALPAAIITFVILLVVGKPEAIPAFEDRPYNPILIIPYLFVLISAIAGMNVFLVLTSGIILSGIIGIATGGLDLMTFAQNIFTGFSGMFEIFLLSMLTGGLSYMVSKNGGIEWLVQKIRSFARGQKSAEVSIALLTALTDAATANNTVAIIIDGPVAKEISNDFKIDPRRSAALLDTFSCVMQGIIPYGAQILIAAGLTKELGAGAVSPMEIIPFLWYQGILVIFAIASIFIRYADPSGDWDFEKDELKEEN
ncbi:MAG: Na+/H+ antiporter NhaC family protein [Peptoniphilus harei]|uniref:Na+/H+ antiporter NhaC family protein n=1 Tax=Peptoniphilus harei TaxID=54005 RepID=UPI00290B5450|nr:Na+/H+ antiporter NhaC family protein [Peptoniphilus harei]MDU5471621.1 Na+/H+ antiporter NhaC family protein [Peptoniphilus harei]MDU6098070.1 Na+/H+ antiporter NhaC family protein [Peptoniphilus harei]